MVLIGDIVGDGCDAAVLWGDAIENGEVVKAVTVPEPISLQLVAGEVGDVPTLGDWDCDGVDTLGFYRPVDGRVFEFPTWPDARPGEKFASIDQPRAEPGGVVRVVKAADGCDEMVVGAS